MTHSNHKAKYQVGDLVTLFPGCEYEYQARGRIGIIRVINTNYSHYYYVVWGSDLLASGHWYDDRHVRFYTPTNKIAALHLKR